MATDTANPTIAIGLGGTGQWALTYLKKNLLDTFGEVPSTVKLLGFDTTSEKTEASVQTEQSEQRAQVGNVTLGPGEFVYLGGNIRKLCEEIVEKNMHPHLRSWLQAKYYLQSTDDDAFEIAKGAGQKRQFGRMAVFYDLSQGENSSKILGKIQQAFEDVKKANQRRQPVEIYLVASLAGGTGSGMFIDIAHITRKIGERVGDPFAIRGFFVLPNAFNPVISIQNILPNSFAAVRELNRFMMVFDRDYPMFYADDALPPQEVYRGIYKNKLFDTCYILDAKRTNLPLDNIRPEFGMFPSVAECLTALLDPAAGNAFDQHYKNVNTTLANAQKEVKKALYSSLGTYTYILPVNDIIERNTQKLVLELLRDYLCKIETDAKGALVVSANANKETPNPAREEALAFLRMPESNNKTKNIPLANQVVMILESGRTKDPMYADQISKMGIEVLNWLEPVEKDKVIADSIQKVMETSIIADVPNAKVQKDDFHGAADRITRDVTKIFEELLGREEKGGTRIPGEFQKGLGKFAESNSARFRTLLAEKIDDLLNGLANDPLVARANKLPYAQAFLEYLIQSFQEYLDFMRRVEEARAKNGELQLAQEDASRTRQIMYETRDLNGIVDKVRGTAVRAEDDYIAATNYLLDQERQAILYRAVIDQTQMLKAVATQMKVLLDRWVQILALGEQVAEGQAQREIGVYRKLLQEQAALKKRREEQARIEVYRYLTDDKYEDSLFDRFITDKVRGEILRRFKWQVSQNENKFQVGFVYGDTSLAFDPPRNNTSSEANAEILSKELRRYFNDIKDETIADRMDTVFTADQAAQNMLKSADVLLSYRADQQKKVETRNYVCVNESKQIQFFNELQTFLRDKASSARENQVIGLSNKQRCIVLSTRDMLIGEAVTPVESAEPTYMKYIGDRRLLHNFPAEVNASGFEQNLKNAPIFEEQRVLSPLIVALLQDETLARMFSMALAFGMIQQRTAETGEGLNQFWLVVDRQGKRDEGRVIYKVPISKAFRIADELEYFLEAAENFVYPKIDIYSGERRIMDVSPSSEQGILTNKVNNAIELRADSIKSGRELVVRAFAELVEADRTLFQAENIPMLVSAFRRFFTENERFVRRSDSQWTLNLEQFMIDNDDTFVRNFRQEVKDKFTQFVKGYEGKQLPVPGKNGLIEYLEEFIRSGKDETDAKKKGWIRRLRPGSLPERKNRNEKPDMLEHDFGTVMEMILLNEIERIDKAAN